MFRSDYLINDFHKKLRCFLEGKYGKNAGWLYRIISNNHATNALVYLFYISLVYKIKKNDLHDDQLTRDLAYFIGNDPRILGLSEFKSEKSIALVATSGVRALAIALELTEKDAIIFLIDNSFFVHQLWASIKKLFSECKDEVDFFKKLPDYLSKNDGIYRTANIVRSRDQRVIEFEEQDITNFFKTQIDKYDFERVKALVQNTILIKQSFAHTGTFQAIKLFCKLYEIDDIYTYPSNIVPFVQTYEKDAKTAYKILENIHLLKPRVSIHSNICIVEGRPEKIFLFDESKPELVRQKLLSESHCIMYPDRKKIAEKNCVPCQQRKTKIN